MVLALALLVVGGMALVNALTSDGGDQPGPTGTATASGGTPHSATAPSKGASASASAAMPLVIRVVGAPTTVVVTVPGTGEVLRRGVLNTGEAEQYDKAPLNVVVSDAGSVEVTIYGELQQRGAAGQRQEWLVPKK
ncbi:hypothetical protein J4573_19135 [Actinomadura barringtoniae]|uniref:DUF4115 domain-containing protein n=2 Tax=Actinomadura barringtoniae TaxID=1427535 RepID=A0A939T7E8_9ACTN|nr:hypothetical protein [Actinomadura barringtoniae]